LQAGWGGNEAGKGERPVERMLMDKQKQNKLVLRGMILPVFLPPASFPQLFTEMLLLDVLGSSSLRENHIKELGLGFRTFVLELSSLLFLLVAVSGDGKSPFQCCLCLL